MLGRAFIGFGGHLGVVLLVACSNDPSRAGNGAGAGRGSGGSATAGSGGSANGGKGVGGAAGEAFRRGDILEFVPGTGDVPYAIGDNAYGIRGGGFLARSQFGNTITVGDEPGKICIQGNLDEVPNGNYGQYWGVEVGFNLNQNGPDDGAGGEAGAPGAAGAGGIGPDTAEAWLPGSVLGFSFVIEGPTIDLIRFKTLPAGYDPALESSVFCKTVVATSGGVNDALFSQIKQYCWNTTPTLPLPTASGLANLSWQLPADVAVGARPFDWCLSELRPLLAP